MKVTYGICPFGHPYESRTFEAQFPGDPELIVLANVPRGLCQSCLGALVYKVEVLERLEGLKKRGLIVDANDGGF
jgi:hypothetical protein